MNFKLYLENIQNDLPFLREYFHEKMNPEVLLVWADNEEENGNTNKAIILRAYAEKKVPDELEMYKRNILGWFFPKKWLTYRHGGERDVISCYQTKDETDEYQLHYKTGLWRILKPVPGRPHVYQEKDANVDDIPYEVLAKVFMELAIVFMVHQPWTFQFGSRRR